MFSVQYFVLILVSFKVHGDPQSAGSKSEVRPKRGVSFDFATELCGLTKQQHKVEGKIGKAKLLGLCGLEAIIRHGCFDNRKKSLNGDVLIRLIDEEKPPNMNQFICDCSEEAYARGYKLFGMTDDFLCWGYEGNDSNLKKLKKSRNCMNDEFHQCKDTDDYCSGAYRTEFVYENIGLDRKLKTHKEKPPMSDDDRLTDFDIKIPKERQQEKKKKKRKRKGKGKGKGKGKDEKEKRSKIDLKEIVPENFDSEFRWPLGKKIPYEIHRSFQATSDHIIISEGLKHIEKYTCVRFRVKKPSEDIKNYLIFAKHPDSCSSPLGMSKDEANVINLAEDCTTKETVVHEVMHSLGFRHEHTREDRGNYLSVSKKASDGEGSLLIWAHTSCYVMNFSSILTYSDFVDYMTGRQEHGGNYTGETFGVGYDFNSVMQYPLDGLNMKLKDKWRVKCQNHKYGCIIGQEFGLSKSDAYQINMLFQCPKKSQKPWGCPEYTDVQ